MEDYLLTIQKSEVPQTDKEKKLKDYYISYIESEDKIEDVVVKGFLLDVEIIRKENSIYWQ